MPSANGTRDERKERSGQAIVNLKRKGHDPRQRQRRQSGASIALPSSPFSRQSTCECH